MPIDSANAKLLIASGLSAVCSFCERMHEALDKGLSGCGQKCGGPIAGGAFDKYKGPITDFSTFCFVCASPATHAVRAKNNLRVLGCCSRHVDTIMKYRPIDKPPIDVVLVSESGETTKLDKDTVIPDKISLKLE